MRQSNEERDASGSKLDPLLEELAAIEYWDQEYLRQDNPGEAERLAFAIRQERRKEILALCGTSVGRT